MRAIKTLIQVLLASTMLLSFSANAQLYAGASIGLANPGSDAKTTEYWGLHAGYRILDYLAVEVGLSDFGTVDDKDGPGSADVETFDYGVLGIYPLNENHELFVKLGFHKWEADVGGDSAFLGSDAGNLDGNDIQYGVGYSAILSDGMGAARIAITHHEFDGAKNEEIDSITFGLEARF